VHAYARQRRGRRRTEGDADEVAGGGAGSGGRVGVVGGAVAARALPLDYGRVWREQHRVSRGLTAVVASRFYLEFGRENGTFLV
jgi:hypothetical protein